MTIQDKSVGAALKTEPVLSARNLSLYIRSDRLIKIVEDVTFDIAEGEFFALVGESGSGKTMIARAIMRLLPDWMLKVEGDLSFSGINLAELSAQEMKRLRGGRIAMIFQEPMTSLNPLMTIGRQIEETLVVHGMTSRKDRRDRILQLLDDVKFKAPAQIIGMYPHELSGGMRQRAMIAMALANDPRLLIADEPTTALDVTIQQEVMEILIRLRDKYRLSVLFISHDLSLVHRYAERIGVLYGGVLMECGPTKDVIEHPAHPYTAALLSCAPRRRRDGERQRGIEGTVPSPTAWFPGCRFAARCPKRVDLCVQERVRLEPLGASHDARCVRPLR
jgi:peptide/nickel transport system ATP-binding protein